MAVTSLLEREAELEALRERVAGLRATSGCVVVIEGRAGAGKTALLNAGVALGRRAGHDVRVVRAREHERTEPGAVIRRLRWADSDGLTTATRELLPHSEANPVIIAVDDLHLADDESVATLLEIADRVEDLAVLLIVALRPGEWPMDDVRLDQLRTAPRASVLRPAPLSPGAVASILKDTAAGAQQPAEQHARWTAGNPFLVTAVARAGGDRATIPDTVAAAVSREVGRMSADEVALARALSILGSGAPLRRVARMAELDRASAESAADRLACVGLLAPGDPLRFHAPMEGAAIADAIGPFARARAHARAANVLIEEMVDSRQIADHLLLTSAAGDAEVVVMLRAAADFAIAEGRPDRAACYLQRALDEPPPPGIRDETLLALINAEALSGRPSSVDHVERIFDRIADGRPRAEALRQLGTLLFLRNEPERAAAALQRGIEHAGDDEQLREALLGDYLAAASFAPSLRAEASARFGEVMQAIAKGGPLPTQTGLLVQVASAMAAGGAPRADVLHIVGELLRENPGGEGPPFGLFTDWICGACIYVDALDIAERVATRSHQAACDAGDVVRQCLTSYWLGLTLLHLGRLTEAVPRLEAALRRQDGGWTSAVPWAAAALCVTELERGRREHAAHALEFAGEPDPDAFHVGVVLEARGLLALASGDPVTALADYEAAGRHLAESFLIDAPTMISWRSNAVFAIRASNGDLERAAALADEELAQARAIGASRQLARALRATAAARPDAAFAVETLQEARAVTSAAGPRLEHLHVLADLSAALVSKGDPMAAREPLSEALEAAETTGAGAVAARMRPLLRATGMRPRRTARAGVGSLTGAELRVAELAAAGHSNPVIADLLTVSQRTVETHLYNTFRKLGIHRRDRLAQHLPLASSRG